MRYAHVINGVVVNVSVWNDPPNVLVDDFGASLVLIDEDEPTVGPGWLYDAATDAFIEGAA